MRVVYDSNGKPVRPLPAAEFAALSLGSPAAARTPASLSSLSQFGLSRAASVSSLSSVVSKTTFATTASNAPSVTTTTTTTYAAAPRDAAGALPLRVMDKFRSSYYAHPKNALATHTLSKTAISAALENRDVVLANPHVFNVKVPLEAKVTNQKSSGRCWIFAAMNSMRLALIKKYNLKDDFELSQPYLFFYDKIEKANWFLENIIELVDSEEVESRIVNHLLKDPVQDGGQWAMLVSLVEKYGVVPKSAYPETYHTSNSGAVGQLITTKLRDYAHELYAMRRERKLSLDALRVAKVRMLDDIYRIAAITVGVPPQAFAWEFHDKDGKFHSFTDLTPLRFYKEHVDFDATKYISLVHDPRNPYLRNYTVAYLGNVQGGTPVRHINLPIDDMKTYALRVLQAGRPVWFGCDVGKQATGGSGVLALGAIDYEAGFGVAPKLGKADRLRYGESAMTHAMLLTGVHVDSESGKTQRWRIENSWSDERGDKGYYVMSDGWFTEYLYQLVVHEDDVPQEVVDVLQQESVVLPAWDPLGALAQ
ncbi:aminopeptidase C [Ramicandelaber brevisporus]|nr:aminopeptidase C [Ramicandelaber brevisporus]